ncbi:hypothetical protein BGX38DRAFT_1308381 [Terfezia claveryi]|nr:hypothetical protein BGX38DRAFT_1308381 [Terfezia claveryi]
MQLRHRLSLLVLSTGLVHILSSLSSSTWQERHRYRHDLESFLYVLIWVCCYPAVAGSANMISSLWPASDPLSQWRDGMKLSHSPQNCRCD